MPWKDTEKKFTTLSGTRFQGVLHILEDWFLEVRF